MIFNRINFEASDGSLLLVSVANDWNIGIWSPFNYSRVGQIIDAHDAGIYCVESLGPNSGYFATGSADSVIKIWDTSSFRFVRRLVGHDESVNTLEILANGYLASGSNDNYVFMWDVSTGDFITLYEMPNLADVNNIKQLKNGILAVATASRKMYFVDMTSASLVNTLTLGTTSTLKLVGALIYNNNQILITGWDQSFTLINTSTYAVIKSYSTGAYRPFCFEYSSIRK